MRTSRAAATLARRWPAYRDHDFLPCPLALKLRPRACCKQESFPHEYSPPPVMQKMAKFPGMLTTYVYNEQTGWIAFWTDSATRPACSRRLEPHRPGQAEASLSSHQHPDNVRPARCRQSVPALRSWHVLAWRCCYGRDGVALSIEFFFSNVLPLFSKPLSTFLQTPHKFLLNPKP